MVEDLIEYQWPAIQELDQFFPFTQCTNITGINPRSSKLINPLLASALDTTGGGT